jgi:FkbM family methyltransferase
MSNSFKSRVKAVMLKMPLGGIFKLARRSGILRSRRSLYWWMRFRGNFAIEVPGGSEITLFSSGASIENSIFWTGLGGDWEPKSIELWLSLARSADVIFDVGANTGIYSLLAKSVNPQAKVYALEPNATVFADLSRNAQTNRFDIHCLPIAVSNFDGSTTFYEVLDRSGYSSSLNSEFLADTATVPRDVPVTRLDSFAAKEGLETLDLLKIDVETHEKEVLEGIGSLLARFRPAILIEILNDDIGKAVESIVANCGYVYVAVDEDARTAAVVTEIRRHRSLNYLLCRPDQWDEMAERVAGRSSK